RPNVPVNVLVGLEFLKAANGWTDEEMYNEFCYNCPESGPLDGRTPGSGIRPRSGQYLLGGNRGGA
ncbi:MAG: hypothetical protein D6793_01630, partial [Thermoflexia bacterium]